MRSYLFSLSYANDVGIASSSRENERWIQAQRLKNVGCKCPDHWMELMKDKCSRRLDFPHIRKP